MSSITIRSLAENSTPPGSADAAARLDADMAHVLRLLGAMGPKRPETCTAPEARSQPSVSMALHRIVRNGEDDPGVDMELRMIHGAAGEIRARIYSPKWLDGAQETPLVFYVHGGGWVVGDLDSYDATPRALCKRLNAVVVSTHYRQAPEFKFPAAHEDVQAAFRWTIENAASLGADPNLLALVGEGSGGNLAVNLCLDAKGEGLPMPRHLALISPMTSTDLGRGSYMENLDTVPLNAATVAWFYRKLLRNQEDWQDTRLNLVDRGDLEHLPPTTIILPALDPLRSEGEALAHAIRLSGVWVDCTTYDGVTHQFFGLAQVVNKAMFAQSQVVRNINESFGRG